ncbi:hypothetical protein C8R46DRAFT_1094929 [Mycena filopes]|nr:hypothetical protein C8R46DRAFT_1094929 [Mycena filopes]
MPTAQQKFLRFFRKPRQPASNGGPPCVSDPSCSVPAQGRVNSFNTTSARNAVKFALQTLSIASSNIPLGSVVSAAIEPLLAVINRVEQTSANAHGIIELAARIELLVPIVTKMAETERRGVLTPKSAGQSRSIVKLFQQELKTITKDLEAASRQGKLNQFFNSAQNSFALQKHNTILANLIADSTLLSVQEVLEKIEALAQSKLHPEPPSSIGLGEITGGLGGGEGQGPELQFRLSPQVFWTARSISGGVGGAGGSGTEVGGEGGIGRGPVITIW